MVHTCSETSGSEFEVRPAPGPRKKEKGSKKGGREEVDWAGKRIRGENDEGREKKGREWREGKGGGKGCKEMKEGWGKKER